jgi:hypothetical protein
MLLVLDVRVRDVSFLIHGVPLPAAAGAFLQGPVVVVEVVEVLAVPLDGTAGPRAFEAGGDGVFRVPLALSVLPAEALLLDGCAFGFGADVAEMMIWYSSDEIRRSQARLSTPRPGWTSKSTQKKWQGCDGYHAESAASCMAIGDGPFSGFKNPKG